MSEAASVPAPEEFDELLTRRIGKINESLEALEVKVDLWDGGEPGAFRTLIAELREDQSALTDAARSVGAAAGDEWRDVAARIVEALDRLESEVAVAWSDFEAEVAEDVESYRAAAGRQLESWRAHVDTMRLQTKLAEMEARDAVADLERAFESTRPELERAKDAAGEALEAVRESAREFVAHLRESARNASRSMR